MARCAILDLVAVNRGCRNDNSPKGRHVHDVHTEVDEILRVLTQVYRQYVGDSMLGSTQVYL